MTESHPDTPLSKATLRRLKHLVAVHYESLRTQFRPIRDAVEPLPDHPPQMWVLNVRVWSYEVGLKTAESAAVHAFDLLLKDITLKHYRDLVLDAANEAFRDVADRDSFGNVLNAMTRPVLEGQRRWHGRFVALVEDAGAASTGPVREVGRRILEYERELKALQNELEELEETLAE